MIRTLAAALATTTCIVALATPAVAQTREFNIPAGSLRSALDAFARQSGRQVIYRGDEVRSAQSPGVRGARTAEDALNAILAGTGFGARKDSSGAFAVAKLGNESTAATEPAAAPGEETPYGASSGEKNNEIVVVGTLIRGVSPIAPVDTYTRQQIERTGASTIEQFARRIPQNLGDATAESIGGGGGLNGAGLRSLGGTSDTRGSAFNLRGLGAGGTLTLVDGRRTSGAGQGGGFVDVSLIALSAVDRIDVLTDGASALYGSDAIGGVVNIALRHDFNGAESSFRIGDSTEGGGRELIGSQLLGTSWGSGNVMAAYEHRDTHEIQQRDRPYLTQARNFFLTPRENSDKAVLSFHQDIGSMFVIAGTGMFGDRQTLSVADTVGSNVNTSNGHARQYGGDLSAEVRLGANWRLNVGGGFTRVNETTDSLTEFDVGAPSQQHVEYTNELTSIDGKLDGPIMALPGGELRAAIFVEYRRQDYSIFDQLANGVRFAPDRSVSRGITGLAGELAIPVIGESNGGPGIRRLEISVAGRYDHYSDVGSTTNPRFGILWEPLRGLRLRGSWSTAFHAPSLAYRIPNRIYIVSDIPDPTSPTGTTRTLIDNSAGTSDLRPETARTFLLGAELAPPSLSRLRMRVNYYKIDYDNRISTPPFPGNNTFNAFQPAASNVQFLISRDPSLALVESYYNCTDCRLLGTAGKPANSVRAILDNRVRNLSETRQEALDASLSWNAPLFGGSLSSTIAATYIFRNRYILIDGAAPIDLRNRFALPVDFRATGSLNWANGGFSSGLTVSYIGPYSNDRYTPFRPISSWATADLYLSYAFAEGHGLLSGTHFAFTVQNLTNERPPYVASPFATQTNYDPANASAVGRFVSFSLRKTW
ncbi:TonB-dependent receptor [Sphingomonas sp. MMSM20]|uniref:TonB-dependent receptor n=1 Tax=Sphingomonas lycopersici TaxID=2951807 RepID=UPI0022374EA4|nr:TonB-dependent receptor [Sphingomonas lycopersici]MCW6531308.1 TonB-dependent receptor [Sphingomonas lycopersici]